MKWLTLLLLTTLSFSTPKAYAQVEPTGVQLCTDGGFWGPNIFTVGDQLTGLHIELVKQAFKDLPYKLSIDPMPWPRCLRAVEEGTLDGVISAAYTEARAVHMVYPPDARIGHNSEWRISNDETVVLVRRDSTYHWTGNIEETQGPVGLPMGDTWVSELETAGLQVHTSIHYLDLMSLLIRNRVRSVLLPRTLARYFIQHPSYSGSVRMLEPGLRDISFYVAFSRSSNLNEASRMQIWNAIKAARNNRVLMQGIQLEAQKNLELCFKEIQRCPQ